MNNNLGKKKVVIVDSYDEIKDHKINDGNFYIYQESDEILSTFFFQTRDYKLWHTHP